MAIVRKDKNGEWVIMIRTVSNTAGRKYKKRGRIRDNDLHCAARDFLCLKQLVDIVQV